MWKTIKNSFLAVLILFVLTLFCTTSVYADDTSLGRTPEGVFPMQENDVIMESEEITVDLEKNSVECIFVFHNTGKSKNVYMGFPGKIYDSMDSGLTQDVNLELCKFKTFVKGKELPITHEKASKNSNTENSEKLNYSEYFTFTVPFEADETITVRNTYDFTPTYDSIGNVYSGYVLKTGAMWKGLIGSAKVTFKLGKIKPYQIERLQPGGFKFEENKLVWERNNFEPRYDLRLTYNTYHYSEEFLKDTTSDEVTKIKQKIERYTNIKELADKGGTDKLITLYNKAVEERDSLLALYISSYLPIDKIPKAVSTLGNISVTNGNYDYYISCDVQGLEAAFSQLTISHNGDSMKILDLQTDTSDCYVRLAPDIEYNITYTLIDWMDRTYQKTLKYKVPELEESSTSEQTEQSVSAEMSASSEVNTEPSPVSESVKDSVSQSANEIASESASESVNNSVSEPVRESISESVSESSIKEDSKLIVWVLLGVVLLGLLVIVVMLRKRQKK